MSTKKAMQDALRLLPKIDERFPLEAEGADFLRKSWSEAVRCGRVVEMPDLCADTESTFILHRDIGRDLSEAHLIDDPFAPAPWVAIQRAQYVPQQGHPGMPKGQYECRAFLFCKITEGVDAGKVIFASLFLEHGGRAYKHTTNGFFDFDDTSDIITMDPNTTKSLRRLGFTDDAEIKNLLDSFCGQAWGTYSAILGFLNTRGVKYQVTETKLNKKGAIIKAGRIVPKNLYVTHIKESAGKVIPRGAYIGSHASPTPHLRRGHVRNLPDGNTTWVRPCMVNVASSDELAFLEQARSRSHYMIK